ncbi:hypothetical protein PILCRDRAFT_381043 [Piloderma croceum F 1598]|uniref:Uncharacterized protein n=1 Tax=Piloderma croceum (strain F 1598) TaxID=765440 RepID=A0A0C3FM32_PILCF|nr:hypothetical protein PILCRDRAFT_381043 [Piloderma croceum F 1598]
MPVMMSPAPRGGIVQRRLVANGPRHSPIRLPRSSLMVEVVRTKRMFPYVFVLCSNVRKSIAQQKKRKEVLCGIIYTGQKNRPVLHFILTLYVKPYKVTLPLSTFPWKAILNQKECLSKRLDSSRE